jgi:hypothetical protein
MPKSVHAKCRAYKDLGGSVAICGRSAGHTDSANAARRLHYDADVTWSNETPATESSRRSEP